MRNYGVTAETYNGASDDAPGLRAADAGSARYLYAGPEGNVDWTRTLQIRSDVTLRCGGCCC